MEWAFQMKRNYTVSYYTEFTCKLNPQSTIKIWALYNGFLQSYRPIVPVQSTVNLSHAHPLAFFLFLFQLNHPPLPLDIFPFLSFSFFLFFSFFPFLCISSLYFSYYPVLFPLPRKSSPVCLLYCFPLFYYPPHGLTMISAFLSPRDWYTLITHTHIQSHPQKYM